MNDDATEGVNAAASPPAASSEPAPPRVDVGEQGVLDVDHRPGTGGTTVDDVDLDAVERDLDGVQAALVRLDDGSYWTDEVTGEQLPDEHLAAHPTARTVAAS